MGRPQTDRRFTPGEMPYYIIGEKTSAKQLQAGVK